MDISVRKNIQLEGKRVSVIGAGRSGISVSRLLNQVGASVILSEKDPHFIDLPEAKELKQIGIDIESGGHSRQVFETDLMVVSPGVPQDADIILTASEKGLPVIAEIELASWFTDHPIVAVTGSNGKTTTTTILYEMYRHQSPFSPFLAGNIGIPFSKVILENLGKEPSNAIYILEVSSFQMEHIHHFKPKIAVLLNLTPNHLDRYHHFEEYISAKMRILKNMTETDFVVYNTDDPILKNWISTPAKCVPFSLKEARGSLFYLNETQIYEESKNILIQLKDIFLPGRHNIANFLAAATAAKILNVPMGSIQQIMKNFRGVPHRIEHVSTLNGIAFYNDSKATTIESVRVALDSFSRPITLILGGRHKGGDFKLLVPHAKNKVKHLILIGEATDIIASALSDIFPTQRASSLEHAVQIAYENSQEGDVILLSPGCASFDMFKNFEDRGNRFKQVVKNLSEKNRCP